MATYEYQPKSKRFYSEMKKIGLVYSEQYTTIVSNIQNYVRIFIYVNPHAPFILYLVVNKETCVTPTQLCNTWLT